MDYKDYLQTDMWKELRRLAYLRANHKCEHCGMSAVAVHHIKYPKRYEDDSIDNLVVVCKKCHELNHGIRDSEKISVYLAGEMNTRWREKFIQYCNEKDPILALSIIWNNPERVYSHAHDGGWFDREDGSEWYDRGSCYESETVAKDCDLILNSDVFICNLSRQDLAGTVTELFHAMKCNKRIILIQSVDDSYWFVENYLYQNCYTVFDVLDKFDNDKIIDRLSKIHTAFANGGWRR